MTPQNPFMGQVGQTFTLPSGYAALLDQSDVIGEGMNRISQGLSQAANNVSNTMEKYGEAKNKLKFLESGISIYGKEAGLPEETIKSYLQQDPNENMFQRAARLESYMTALPQQVTFKRQQDEYNRRFAMQQQQQQADEFDVNTPILEALMPILGVQMPQGGFTATPNEPSLFPQ